MGNIKKSTGLSSHVEIKFSAGIYVVNPRYHNKIITIVIYKASKLQMQVKCRYYGVIC